MSGEVFLMGNSSVTKAAGVIRVSYPANSTLVVKGTSSGKQFAKDTNTTSSAKAYIFLAPIGDASYTLTATNTAGKTVSKQVYVAKDQMQSVVLTYELILFDGGDNTSVTGGWEGRDVTPTVSNVLSFSLTNYDTTFGKAASVYAVNKFDLSQYNKLTVVKSEANGWYIGVTENKFSWGVYPPGADSIGFAAYTGLSGNDNRIELDISGIDTECYVAIYMSVGSKNPELDAVTYSATLTNITLS